MKRSRKIILIVAIAGIGVIGWITYGIFHTLAHIPEAYAAWDTGTLLVQYMKSHDDRWPASWDDLMGMAHSKPGQQIRLHSSHTLDDAYASELRKTIAIDWHFDPQHPEGKRPVTRPDGSAFPVVWEEPNEIVQNYLRDRSATRPSLSK